MVAATKNKRGRPADSLYAKAVRRNILNHAYNPEISERTVQNTVNANEFICLLIESDSDLQRFFSCCNGQTKHKGIAEQLGRMMREGLITEEQAIQTAENAIKAYASGMTSKEIENTLRQYRMSRKRGIRSQNKKAEA